jgi:hypothetical protein
MLSRLSVGLLHMNLTFSMSSSSLPYNYHVFDKLRWRQKIYHT